MYACICYSEHGVIVAESRRRRGVSAGFWMLNVERVPEAAVLDVNLFWRNPYDRA